MKNHFSVDSRQYRRKITPVVLYALCVPGFLWWRWTNVIYLSQFCLQIPIQVLLSVVSVVILRTVPFPFDPQHITHINVIHLFLFLFRRIMNNRVVFAWTFNNDSIELWEVYSFLVDINLFGRTRFCTKAFWSLFILVPILIVWFWQTVS